PAASRRARPAEVFRMAGRFVPLHALSHFLLNEGVDAPEALLGRAAEAGYSRLGPTHMNSPAGAVGFVRVAGLFSVRPLLGAGLRQRGPRYTCGPPARPRTCGPRRGLSRPVRRPLWPRPRHQDGAVAPFLCHHRPWPPCSACVTLPVEGVV